MSVHLLTQQAADLGEIDEGPLGSRHCHQRQAIVRKGLPLPAWQADLHASTRFSSSLACVLLVIWKYLPISWYPAHQIVKALSSFNQSPGSLQKIAGKGFVPNLQHGCVHTKWSGAVSSPHWRAGQQSLYCRPKTACKGGI